MKDATFVLFVVCALVSEILGTLGGFGSSMLFVPIANFFMDFQAVLGITAVFHIFSNTSKLWLFRKHLDWKTIGIIGVPSVVFVLIGAVFSAKWNSSALQMVLGIFLCLIAVLFLIKPSLKVKKNNAVLLSLGGLAGFVAGLLGTGGAIRGIALSSLGFGKELFIGTSAAIDFAVDFARAVVYWESGFIRVSEIYYIIALFFVAIIGSYIGKKMLEKMDQNQFQKIVLIFIFISGGLLIIKQFKIFY